MCVWKELAVAATRFITSTVTEGVCAALLAVPLMNGTVRRWFDKKSNYLDT